MIHPTPRILFLILLGCSLLPCPASAHRKGGMGPRPGPPPRMNPGAMVPSHVPTANVGKNPVSDRVRQRGRPDGEEEAEPPTALSTEYGTDRGDFGEEGEEIFVSETGEMGPDGPVNRTEVRVLVLPDGRRRRVSYGPDGSIASIFDMFPDGRAVDLSSVSAVQAFAEAHGEDYAGGKLSDGMVKVLGAIASLPSGNTSTSQDPAPRPVPGRGGSAIP